MLNKDICRIIALKLSSGDTLNFFSTCKTLNRDENYGYYLKHKYKEDEKENRKKLVYIKYCEKMLNNIFDLEYKYDKPFSEFRKIPLNFKFLDKYSSVIKNEKVEEFNFLINHGYEKVVLTLIKDICNKLTLLKLLINKNRNFCKTRKHILIRACRFGDIKIVKFLLESGFDIHMIDNKPLIEAVKHIELAVFLVRRGANLFNLPDFLSLTDILKVYILRYGLITPGLFCLMIFYIIIFFYFIAKLIFK